MNQQEMKLLFRRSLYEVPPEGAMEKCLSALPAVEPEHSIFRLLCLQMRSLPRYIPGAAAAAFIMIVIAGKYAVGAEQIMLFSGSVLAGVGLLLLSHMFLVRSSEMMEVEACCRYRFCQIVLSRCLCSVFLLAGFCAAVCVVMAASGSLSPLKMPVILLPLTVSCAAALGIHLMIRTEYDSAAWTVYLLAAFLTVMGIPPLAETAVWMAGILLAVSVCVILFETRMIVIRSEKDEAFNL